MGQSLLVCAYRSMSIQTHDACIAVLSRPGWKHSVRYGDALISRARSVVVSAWYTQTDDDVFLMVDDDIRFTVEDAERLVEKCRDGYEIISSPVPVHNGEFIASRPLKGIKVDYDAHNPIPMEYVGAAFVAIHRRVIDSLIDSVPLCHPRLPIAFWPFFMPFVQELDGDPVYLSEDWAFVARANSAGHQAWIDPTVRVGHKSDIILNLDNMHDFYHVFGEKWEELPV